jgi:hypothetical protein
MTLAERQASFDQKFLWLGRAKCDQVNYSWASEDDVSAAWQMILPPKHPTKRPGDVQLLEVKCGNHLLISGEVTANNGLVFFYDGYYFFASKEAP